MQEPHISGRVSLVHCVSDKLQFEINIAGRAQHLIRARNGDIGTATGAGFCNIASLQFNRN